MRFDVIWNSIKRYTMFVNSVLKLSMSVVALLTLSKIMFGAGIDCMSLLSQYLKLTINETIIFVFALYYILKESK